jgi:hypothetical protein
VAFPLLVFPAEREVRDVDFALAKIIPTLPMTPGTGPSS